MGLVNPEIRNWTHSAGRSRTSACVCVASWCEKSYMKGYFPRLNWSRSLSKKSARGAAKVSALAIPRDVIVVDVRWCVAARARGLEKGTPQFPSLSLSMALHGSSHFYLSCNLSFFIFFFGEMKNVFSYISEISSDIVIRECLG